MKLDRITSNPNRMNGQPCIRNLRLTVRRVIELLATYPNREELRQEFPEVVPIDMGAGEMSPAYVLRIFRQFGFTDQEIESFLR